MASKKAGGTAKNLTDSKAKYLGVKLFGGEKASRGDVIVRQRGTKMIAGTNVGVGRDHTLFALKDGVVTFKNTRKIRYDGRRVVRSTVSVN